MTYRQHRAAALRTTSGLALTAGVASYCCIFNPSRLGEPRPGFKWRWVGIMPKSLAEIAAANLPSRARQRGWPCRSDEFVEEYAGSLVGFGARVPDVGLQ